MSSFDDFEFDIGDDIMSLYNPSTPKKKKGQFKADPRIYSPKLNAENGYSYSSKIRLLYNPQLNNKAPSLKVMRHFFQDTYTMPDGTQKKWTTSHVCPKTFGKPCPTCDSYWDYRNRMEKDKSPQLKAFFEKYISKRNATISHLWNILVKDDRVNADNNNQVKAFYMTNGLYNILQKTMYPDAPADEFADEDGADVYSAIPFHPVKGVDLIMVINKDDRGWTSYANSRFRAQKSGEYIETPIVDDPDAIKEILNQCHDFSEFISEDKLLSLDELTEKLRVHDEKVFGQTPQQAEGFVESAKASTASRTSAGPGVEVPSEHMASNSVETGDDDDYWAKDDTAPSDDEFDVSDITPSGGGSDDDDELPF